MKFMLIYAYMMYWHEILDGFNLYVEKIIIHDSLMLHVALIMHVT